MGLSTKQHRWPSNPKTPGKPPWGDVQCSDCGCDLDSGASHQPCPGQHNQFAKMRAELAEAWHAPDCNTDAGGACILHSEEKEAWIAGYESSAREREPAAGEVLFHMTDNTEYATLHADDYRKGMLDRDHAIADLTRERDELRRLLAQAEQRIKELEAQIESHVW